MAIGSFGSLCRWIVGSDRWIVVVVVVVVVVVIIVVVVVIGVVLIVVVGDHMSCLIFLEILSIHWHSCTYFGSVYDCD